MRPVMIARAFSLARTAARRFLRDERGNLVYASAIALIPIAAITGVAIDFGVAFYMRQKLDGAAETAFAAALAQSRSVRAARWDVSLEEMQAKGRARADLVFNSQRPNVRNITSAFTLTRVGTANVFDARVYYTAEVNTIFLRFVGVKDLDVRGEAATTWVARDALIDDTFDDKLEDIGKAAGKFFAAPSGWLSNSKTTVSGVPAVRLAAAAHYDGPPPPEGVAVAVELDAADGNMFVTKKVSAEPGPHTLRYWYRDRVRDAFTAPAWLCGTREEDIEWMRARDQSGAGDTNRMSVYLTADSNDRPPAEMAFNAASRIDSCYSSGYRWIERVVKIDILTRGDYWLTFRGEGRSDGTGAAIANALFCREPCADENAAPRPPADPYPWRPDTLLFEDRFTASGANPLQNSPGANGGWDRLPPGWTAWPVNHVAYKSGEKGLSGYVSLDVPTKSGEFENRGMGRAFLFTPGFYQLRYTYAVGPNSLNRVIACNYFGLEAALMRVTRVKGADTHRINVFIDPDMPYLHPEASEQAEDAQVAWYSAARVIERDISGTKPQRVPDPTNAVDFCAGAPPSTATVREINFKIEKAGYYWIAFTADGPADGDGGRIGNVQLFAKGSTFSGASIPRIIRHAERGDFTIPPVGSWVIKPPGDASRRPLYRVQVQ